MEPFLGTAAFLHDYSRIGSLWTYFRIRNGPQKMWRPKNTLRSWLQFLLTRMYQNGWLEGRITHGLWSPLSGLTALGLWSIYHHVGMPGYAWLHLQRAAMMSWGSLGKKCQIWLHQTFRSMGVGGARSWVLLWGGSRVFEKLCGLGAFLPDIFRRQKSSQIQLDSKIPRSTPAISW